MKTILFFYRLYFSMLSGISTQLAANQAFLIFQKPRKKKMKPKEIGFYTSAKATQLQDANGSFHLYSLGTSDAEPIILVHGWESNVGSMAGIAKALVAQGKRVITADLPAHGSSKEKRANLKTCTDRLAAVIQTLSHIDQQQLTVVAHSFGSLVSAYTLRTLNLSPKQLILLTTPKDTYSIFQGFKNIVQLNEKVFKTILSMGKKLLGEDIREANTIKCLQACQPKKLLLIHDKNDKMLSYSISEKLHHALPHSTMRAYTNIGHYRMLWNTEVIGDITSQLDLQPSLKEVTTPV